MHCPKHNVHNEQQLQMSAIPAIIVLLLLLLLSLPVLAHLQQQSRRNKEAFSTSTICALGACYTEAELRAVVGSMSATDRKKLSAIVDSQ
jgi:hypothetical protein